MNSLYGEQITKDIEEEYVSKSEYWMFTEYDERVKDYKSIRNRKYFVNLAQDEGKEDDNDEISVVLLHLGSFVLSNSKGKMNYFVEAVGGFRTKEVYCRVTDSIYIEKKFRKKVDEMVLVRKNIIQGKND